MHLVVEVVIGFLALGAGIAALTVGLVWRQAQRAVRLVPRRPSLAPLSWTLHPGRPAQLHRRLRQSCRAVTAAVGTPSRSLHPSRRRRPSSPLTRVGAEVIDRAVALDARLVAASRLPAFGRRAALHQLAAEVRAVEDAARRVRRLDAVWREHLHAQAAPALPEPDLGSRIDAMEAALAELGVAGAGAPARDRGGDA